MINDVLLAGTLIVAAFGVGLPLAMLLPRETQMRALAAPPFGLALLAVALTITYRFGFPLWVPISGAGLISVLTLGWSAIAYIRGKNNARATTVLASSCLVLALCLLPKWIGGNQFASFQGNEYDHFNYIAQAVTFKRYPYAYVKTLEYDSFRDNNFMGWVNQHIDTRPAATIVLSTVAAVTWSNVVEQSYAYLGALQAMVFFSALFIILNVFEATAGARFPIALASAAAVTIGFPLQYILDINAWGELSVMSIAIISMASVLILLEPSDSHWRKVSLWNVCSWSFLIAILGAGIFYLYPESLTIDGALASGALATWLIRHGAKTDFRRVIAMVVGLAGAVLISLAYFPGSLGYLRRQLTFATVNNPNWWEYFQKYLLPDNLAFSQFPKFIKYIALGPIDIGLGAIGMYFVGPHGSHSLAIECLWQILAGLLLIGLLWSAYLAFARAESRRAELLTTAALAAFAVIVLIAISGRFWAAGKGLSMAGPFLFFPLVAPLFLNARKAWRERVPAFVLVAAYIGFGLARPVFAISGIGYPVPYPSSMNPEAKERYIWDLPRHRTQLQKCRAISLDLENPTLDRYAQLYLTDLGARWSSVRPLNTNLGIGKDLGIQPQLPNPDCLVTTNPLAAVEKVADLTVIVLVSDMRLVNFVRDPHGFLEIGVHQPPGVEISGAYDVENWHGRDLRWTGEVTRISLPNDPANPAKRLTLETLGFGPVDRKMKVSVNGTALYDGNIVVGSATWDLSSVSASKLEIELSSETIHTAQDPRNLGVAMRGLTLTK